MESDRWPLCFSVDGSVHGSVDSSVDGSVDSSVHGSVHGSVDQSFRREIGKFGRFIKKFNRIEKNRETKGSYILSHRSELIFLDFCTVLQNLNDFFKFSQIFMKFG